MLAPSNRYGVYINIWSTTDISKIFSKYYASVLMFETILLIEIKIIVDQNFENIIRKKKQTKKKQTKKTKKNKQTNKQKTNDRKK